MATATCWGGYGYRPCSTHQVSRIARSVCCSRGSRQPCPPPKAATRWSSSLRDPMYSATITRSRGSDPVGGALLREVGAALQHGLQVGVHVAVQRDHRIALEQLCEALLFDKAVPESVGPGGSRFVRWSSLVGLVGAVPVEHPEEVHRPPQQPVLLGRHEVPLLQ
eukprot:scaffold41942_cov76-Phaeocystis_antarctica.AAC.11